MDVNLENWFKPNIEKKDLKELSRRRDGPGLFHFFIYCTPKVEFSVRKK